MKKIIHALLTSIVSLSLIISLDGISYSQKSQHVHGKQQGTPVMWTDPTDVQHRNLFYGIGGKENAPDPSIAYEFLARSTAGTQPKIIVEVVGGTAR